MKLYAVIYALFDCKSKNASPKIAGIYSKFKLAEIIKKCVGGNAEIHEVEVDEISKGYDEIAKNVFQINLQKEIDLIKADLRLLSDDDKECLITADDFISDEECGALTSDDGCGYWATETEISSISCWRERPVWATHVCWFNR